jgi:hypothetical protein
MIFHVLFSNQWFHFLNNENQNSFSHLKILGFIQQFKLELKKLIDNEHEMQK